MNAYTESVHYESDENTLWNINVDITMHYTNIHNMFTFQ